jgi:hypothetical protein
MNNIRKFQIKLEKLIPKEELFALNGGDYPVRSCCYCWNGAINMGIIAAWGQEDCTSACAINGWDGCWGSC